MPDVENEGRLYYTDVQTEGFFLKGSIWIGE